jgi:WD40 repeat protein
VTLPPPPADPDATLAPDRAADSPHAALAHDEIPGYAILRELGRGGMGVVYLARQVKLGRQVALKMILAGGHAGAADLARFRTEAEAVARLQHPHIVQVYEVGEHDGRPFLSLEYCPGGGLDQKLAGTPLPPVKAAALVETLARATAAAHRASVVHRDLKPANVLLTADGEPKITDFGLAKKLDEAGQTASNAIVGTPSYMAPEQAGGRKDVGPAADVYALGAILYECLTGRPPFKAATPLDTVLQVVADEPVPPTQLQRKTPRDLETVCLKCLRKQPERRYGGATELADDLRRFQAGEPIHARPVGRAERAWRWCKRYPAVAALLVLSLAFCLILGVLVSVSVALRQRAVASARDAEQRRREAEEGKRQAQQGKQEAERSKRELEDKKRETDEILYAAGFQLAQREWEAGNTQRVSEQLEDCPPRLRGWEWDFLHGLVEGAAVLRGHGKFVAGVALSPDGRTAATLSHDGTARVWDVARQADRFSIPGNPSRLAIGPDGRRLAVALGAEVQVRDLATGRVLARWSAGKPVCGLAFVRGGRQLAVAAVGGSVAFFDPASGAERSRLGRSLPFDPQTERMLVRGWGVAFSPDGRRLAQGGGGGKVRVWDAGSGELLLEGAGHRDQVGQPAFSPDGRRLASPGGEGTVRVWDLDGKQPPLTLRGHTGTVCSVTFSPDGRRLLSGSQDMTARLWDARAGVELRRFRGHASEVWAVAFDGSGRRAATASPDGTARVFAVAEPVLARHARDAAGQETTAAPAPGGAQEAVTFDSRLGYLTDLAFSPDGRLAATAAVGSAVAPHQVTVWDLDRRRELHRIDVRGHRLHRVAFSPDGRLLAVGTGGGDTEDPAELAVYGVADGRRLWHWQGPPCLVVSPAFSSSPESPVAAAAIGRKEALLGAWDARTGAQRFPPRKLAGARTHVSYARDGRELLLAGADSSGHVQIERYDADTGRPLRPIPTTAVGLTVFVCSGGDLAAGADVLGPVRLWRVSDGKELAVLEGHAGAVRSLAFSPDGKRLLSGGSDLTVRLWDTRTFREQLAFRQNASVQLAVAWSGDGRRVGAAGLDGLLRVWTAPTRPDPPRTDDWPVLFRADFPADGPDGRFASADGSRWQARGGALRTRLVTTRLPNAAGEFPCSTGTLPGVRLPRTVEVRVSYRAEKPLTMALTLKDPATQRLFAAGLSGGSMPYGSPRAGLLYLTDTNANFKMSRVGVFRKFRTEPGRWRQVRLLREPGRLHLWVGDEEKLNERIAEIDLPVLGLQAAWGTPGDEIEFKDLEIRAPAAAVREEALRARAKAVFGRVLLRQEVRARLPGAERPVLDRILAELAEDPFALEEAAARTAHRRGGAKEDYDLALNQAQATCRAEPDHPRFAQTLGVAQYRAGRYADAAATLGQARPRLFARDGDVRPLLHAVLAMARHRLGQAGPARAELGRARDGLLSDYWASSAADHEAAREAAALLGAAKPASPDEEAIRRLVTRAAQDGWLRHKLAEYLAAYTADAKVINARSEQPGPHDVVLDRARLGPLRRLDFRGPPAEPDRFLSFHDVRVEVNGDGAELRLRATAHFGVGGDYQEFAEVDRLRRTPQGWRVREARSWLVAERFGGVRKVHTAGSWAALDAAADQLADSPDLLARARALQAAGRPAGAYEVARRAARGDAGAAAWVLCGDLAHQLGHVDAALAAFRKAQDKDPDAELPWYMSRGRFVFRGHGGTAGGVAWHPGGKLLLSAGPDGLCRLWEAATGKEVWQRGAKGEPLDCAAFSPDGRLAAAAGKVVRVYDVETGKEVCTCAGHTGVIYRIAFSPDGKRLATASADRTAAVYAAHTGQRLLTLRGHGDEVLGVAFHPTQPILATASHDKTARLHDAATGKLVRTLAGHTDVVKRVEFSPDGERLLTASGDRTVRVWQTSTGKQLRKLVGHDALVDVALFSPDGKRVASAGFGGSGAVRLHDAATGRQLPPLTPRGGGVYALAFRPDGKMLATAGDDGVILWDVGP